MVDYAKYKNVVYDDARYNCLHFACEVYHDLTGIDLSSDVKELCTTRNQRQVCPEKLSHFILIAAPKSPCIAVLRSATNVHCGIYIDGNILHLDQSGINSQAPHIAQRQFSSVKYYDYNVKEQHKAADESRAG